MGCLPGVSDYVLRWANGVVNILRTKIIYIYARIKADLLDDRYETSMTMRIEIDKPNHCVHVTLAIIMLNGRFWYGENGSLGNTLYGDSFRIYNNNEMNKVQIAEADLREKITTALKHNPSGMSSELPPL